MVKQVLDEMRHPDTPKEVEIRAEAPPPVADGTFGIPVELDVRDGPAPVNRLVTIGDSLTHGFKSFAVSDTELSYPAMIAGALGWGSTFRFATYPGPGGLPLSL